MGDIGDVSNPSNPSLNGNGGSGNDDRDVALVLGIGVGGLFVLMGLVWCLLQLVPHLKRYCKSLILDFDSRQIDVKTEIQVVSVDSSINSSNSRVSQTRTQIDSKNRPHNPFDDHPLSERGRCGIAINV